MVKFMQMVAVTDRIFVIVSKKKKKVIVIVNNAKKKVIHGATP